MFQKHVVIHNASGLHARPASQLTQFCKNFQAEIKIIHGTHVVEPKSIISILAAGMKTGSEVEVQVTGDDEDAIGQKLVDFIDNLTD